MRAGLPATVAPAGTSRVTTLPAPISASSPTVTPGSTIAPPPIHGLAGFPAFAALRGIARVVGRVDLHRGADLRAVADLHAHHVEDHAVEIEEHAAAQMHVEAVVAMEGRPDLAAFARGAQSLGEQGVALRRRHAQCGVVANEPFARGGQI